MSKCLHQNHYYNVKKFRCKEHLVTKNFFAYQPAHEVYSTTVIKETISFLHPKCFKLCFRLISRIVILCGICLQKSLPIRRITKFLANFLETYQFVKTKFLIFVLATLKSTIRQIKRKRNIRHFRHTFF